MQDKFKLLGVGNKDHKEHLESAGQVLCMAGRMSLLKELTSYTIGYLLS